MCDSWLMSCVKHEQAVIVSTIVHHNNNNNSNNSNRFSTNPKLHFLSSPLPSVSKNQTLVWLPLSLSLLFSSLSSLYHNIFKWGVGYCKGRCKSLDDDGWWLRLLSPFWGKVLPCSIDFNILSFPMLFQCLFKSSKEVKCKKLFACVGTVTPRSLTHRPGQRVNGHRAMNHSVKGWMICEQETTFSLYVVTTQWVSYVPNHPICIYIYLLRVATKCLT